MDFQNLASFKKGGFDALSAEAGAESTTYKRFSNSFLAPRVGFEPTTPSLTASGSAAELPGNKTNIKLSY